MTAAFRLPAPSNCRCRESHAARNSTVQSRDWSGRGAFPSCRRCGPCCGVRCGIRQLRINRLVATGIHEHPRVVMTNSMCNSGRDSTRPPGPATDRRRILTRDASTSRLIKPSAGCVCAQAIAAHTRPRDTNLPDRTAEDSHRRAPRRSGLKEGPSDMPFLRAGLSGASRSLSVQRGLHDGLPT